MRDKALVGSLFCAVAGAAWGAQFPIAGRVLTLIDPFHFTLLRYLAVSLILGLLLILSEGIAALRFEGQTKRLWFYGTMAFTLYNFLVFLGQKAAGASGAALASLMMALMPMASVLVMWVCEKTRPSTVTLGCIVAAFVGVLLVITKGDLSVLSSTSGSLIPTGLMLAGVFAWVIYTMGGSQFTWSPLRYTTLSCLLGTASALGMVGFATIAGYLRLPAAGTLWAIRWEMTYMIVVSGVLALFSWNAGNRALTPINGILFINLVPVTTFVISTLSGYEIGELEVVGATVTITSLVLNNLYQRAALRGDDRASTDMSAIGSGRK